MSDASIPSVDAVVTQRKEPREPGGPRVPRSHEHAYWKEKPRDCSRGLWSNRSFGRESHFAYFTPQP